MSELFSNLGIEWKVIIAQIINFGILLFVLKYFLYKPVIKVLDDRKAKIADDIEKSKAIDEKLLQIDKAKEEVLGTARRDGEKMLAQSKKSGEEIKDALVKEASKEAEKILEDAKKQISNDREKTMQDVKKEIGSLIAISIERVLGDVSDKSIQDRLVEEAVKKIK